MPAKLTDPDCRLDGKPFAISRWKHLTSAELARIVGTQCQGSALEYAKDYDWEFVVLATEDLKGAAEDGEPDRGWEMVYWDHVKCDQEAIADGSPEYAGRQEWLEKVWCLNTAIYPLFLVHELGEYLIWDGYHRLAGAFHHDVKRIACLLGRPKRRQPKRQAAKAR